MSQIGSPARRVLGEKNVNASINITSPKGALKPTIRSSHATSPEVRSNVMSTRPELLPPTMQAGRKRRINEVEGVEERDWENSSRSSQATEIMSDSALDTPTPEKYTSGPSASQLANSAGLPGFGNSQTDPQTLETHFELPREEMSQKSLEKMHAVPLPQNNSQAHVYGPHPALRSESTYGSVGMSSLIDFGGSDASQPSDGLPPIDERDGSVKVLAGKSTQPQVPVPVPAPSPMLTEEQKRKILMDEKAAELRTRLQFAYFKVQTNQTTTPFSRLKVPESMKRVVKAQNKSHAYSIPSSYARRSPSHPTYEQYGATTSQVPSPESRISAMRAQATAQVKPPVKSLGSLPMPKLDPDAPRSRYTTKQPTPDVEAEPNNTVNIPSSPPLSIRSSSEHDKELLTRQRSASKDIATHATHTNDQLSSPPPSQDGESERDEEEDQDATLRTAAAQSHQGTCGDTSLTSSFNSPVKGEAANGLLQLMRGVGGGKGMCGL